MKDRDISTSWASNDGEPRSAGAAATAYAERREALRTYFDRTARRAWIDLTSDAKVSRIRRTVRAGRDEMRSTLLSWLPERLAGAPAGRRLRHGRLVRSRRRTRSRGDRDRCRRGLIHVARRAARGL
jgi:hypothetical protein